LLALRNGIVDRSPSTGALNKAPQGPIVGVVRGILPYADPHVASQTLAAGVDRMSEGLEFGIRGAPRAVLRDNAVRQTSKNIGTLDCLSTI
jgi:hypothetical protein